MDRYLCIESFYCFIRFFRFDKVIVSPLMFFYVFLIADRLQDFAIYIGSGAEMRLIYQQQINLIFKNFFVMFLYFLVF